MRPRAVCSAISIHPGEADCGGSSAAADPGDRQRGPEGAVARFCRAVFADRPRVDPARAAAARLAAAGVPFASLGAATGRADRHRPVVPLVCRSRHRGPGVERHHLYEEPRPAVERRDCGEVSRRGARRQAGQGVVVGRAFLGRRHLAGSLGQPEELPPEDGAGTRPARDAMPRAIFTASGAGTTPMPRPPTPTPGCSARAAARKPGCASWATR
jgi:hypothetical protein